MCHVVLRRCVKLNDGATDSSNPKTLLLVSFRQWYLVTGYTAVLQVCKRDVGSCILRGSLLAQGECLGSVRWIRILRHILGGHTEPGKSYQRSFMHAMVGKKTSARTMRTRDHQPLLLGLSPSRQRETDPLCLQYIESTLARAKRQQLPPTKNIFDLRKYEGYNSD